jgi:serine/threonine-protein kinase
VLGVSVDGLTLGEGATATATVIVRTNGTAPVFATATWAAPGTGGHVQRVRLAGARFYSRTLTWSMGERPCGNTVTLTLTTSPAASGGARTASVSVPPCPTRVTGLRVSLGMPAAPGRTATARIRVRASGTGEIPVEARFAINGDGVGTQTASLSGRTSYSRTLTHTFKSRPCGATLSVTVRAGGRTATARTSVPCPPQVRQVSIVEAGPGRGGLSATVRVTTTSTQPVRLNVSFSTGGEGGGTRSVTLSGGTSYTETLSLPVKLSCGTKWSVTAATAPAAAGGSDSSSGSTQACPPKDPPSDPPKDPPTEQTKDPKPSETPSTESPGTIE